MGGSGENPATTGRTGYVSVSPAAYEAIIAGSWLQFVDKSVFSTDGNISARKRETFSFPPSGDERRMKLEKILQKEGAGEIFSR